MQKLTFHGAIEASQVSYLCYIQRQQKYYWSAVFIKAGREEEEKVIK